MKTTLVYLFLIHSFVQITTAQRQDNCLKRNPGILHGEFIWYNKVHGSVNTSASEFSSMINLFVSRFQNAYVLAGVPNENLRQVLEAFATRTTTLLGQVNPSLYVTCSIRGGNSYNDTVTMLHNCTKMIQEVDRKGRNKIPGFMVQTGLNAIRDEIRAISEVLKSEEYYSMYKVGKIVTEEYFKPGIRDAEKTLFKFDFLIILMLVNGWTKPQKLAESLVYRCDEYRQIAAKKSNNTKILCAFTYPSEGEEKSGWNPDLRKFREFWCQVVRILSDGSEHAEIIMKSAFDASPFVITPEQRMYTSLFHRGWWKHINDSILNESAFVEKIDKFDELEDNIQNCFCTGYIIIIVGLSLMTAIVVVLSGVFALYLIKTNTFVKSLKLTIEDVKLFEDGIPDSTKVDQNSEGLLVPYDKKYEISKSSLTIYTTILLGKGEHGAVYSGYLTTLKENVAVKSTCLSLSSESVKLLLTEIKIMIHVGSHPNLVHFYGAYTAEKITGNVSMVLELCEFGSMINILRQPDKLSLLMSKKETDAEGERQYQVEKLGRKWAYEIARGMHHISSKNVIHGDLAARNVLIARDGCAKITDFGLSRKLYSFPNYVKHKQEPLPWRWMAPESLKHMSFSTESDVWAYGVTLYEIFSGGLLPYPGMVWDFSFVELLENGFKNTKPDHASDTEYGIMEMCWQVVPSNRPSFAELLTNLEDMYPEDAGGYMKCE